MTNKEKIITQLPLTNLWTEEKEISSIRERYLTREEIRQILKANPVQFVIANVGDKLQWISMEKCHSFWKSEVINHLSDSSDRIILEEFPDRYAYLASMWNSEIQTPIILLEKHH